MELLILRALIAPLLSALLSGGPEMEGSATPRALWEKKVCPAPAAAPVVSNDTVWVAGTDRKLRSIEADTGKGHWKKGLPGFPTTAPVPANDLLVIGIGGGDRGVCAVDRRSGKLRWFEKTVTSPIAIVRSGENLCSVSAGGRLTARALSDGAVVWTEQLGTSVAGIEIGRGRLYVLGKKDSLWCLDPADGSRHWAVPVVGFHSFGPVVTDSTLLRLRYDGQLIVHDLATGTARRRATLAEPQVTRPTVFDGRIFSAAAGGEVECWDLPAMDRTWIVRSDETINAGGTAWADWIVVPTAEGRVLAITRSRGAQAWVLTFRDPVTRPPGFDKNRLALIDDRGRMVVYRLEGS